MIHISGSSAQTMLVIQSESYWHRFSPSSADIIVADDIASQVYSYGYNRDKKGFAINKGLAFGTYEGIFVTQSDINTREMRVGINLGHDEYPRANLHVSGNAGILIQGQLRFFDDVYRQNVVDAFNQPGSQLQFNPYSASFRSGMFFDSENYFKNVGVFSAGTGYSNQVSGNLAVALGGASQRVSGFYSTAMGGTSNDILSGVSFSGGRGSYIDHHGSFVFSHSGFLPPGVTSVSQDDRLKTTDSRQFLIGTPQNSFSPAYLGINTNNSYG